MKTTAAGCAVVLLSCGWIAALSAHHSPSMFATDTAVTIQGKIVRFDVANPHSYLYLDRETEDGSVERWVVEGPAPNQHEQRGIRADALTAGAIVEACGYVLKDTARGPRGMERRVLLAELMFTPDGEGRLWSDYGRHRCRDRYRGDVRLR